MSTQTAGNTTTMFSIVEKVTEDGNLSIVFIPRAGNPNVCALDVVLM